MRKLLFVFGLLLLIATQASATNYFIAPAAGGGSDANNGTSVGTPWLTPNHALNCGDTITGAAGTYSDANFQTFGTVTCVGGNNVAWLKCVTFDACKISATSNAAMNISKSYWGVVGWEVSSTGNDCFIFRPVGATEIHHALFANDIANGCLYAGFEFDNGGSGGEDYLVVIGSIAYNTTTGTAACESAFNVDQPSQSDSLPGTHIYLAGNFAWNNTNGACNSGAPTDGQGFNFDTFSNVPYTQQAVIDNNIALFNGGRGINSNNSTSSHIYFRHNTAYANNQQTGQNNNGNCGEVEIWQSTPTEAFLNLAETYMPVGCGSSNTEYAFVVKQGDATDVVYTNWGYDASGNNDGITSSPGFSYNANNTFGTNPNFANPVDPSAPSCGSFTSVPACMATVIANFTPTTAAAKSYGYQPVSTTSVYDPLYPQWLCTVTNLPTGLVRPGCLTGTAASGAMLSGTTVH